MRTGTERYGLLEAAPVLQWVLRPRPTPAHCPRPITAKSVAYSDRRVDGTVGNRPRGRGWVQSYPADEAKTPRPLSSTVLSALSACCSLWIPQGAELTGTFLSGGRYPGGLCPGASDYSLHLDSSSSEQSQDLLHSSGWATRSRCVQGALGLPGKSRCTGGRGGWGRKEGLGIGTVGVRWAPGHVSSRGWAVRPLLPLGPGPPADSCPSSGWSDAEENRSTGGFVGTEGARHVALSSHE